MNGRGNDIGPDLTTIRNQTGITRDWLLKHIVNPNAEMAPYYRPQQLLTTDGKVLTGLIVGREGKKQAYVQTNGEIFFIDKTDIEERQELTTSIMPLGLLDKFYASEIRDLIVYVLEGEELPPDTDPSTNKTSTSTTSTQTRKQIQKQTQKKQQRPNVLFILTDDQRYDALSCMGHAHLKTPHIDRLAAEGLLFKNHFCTTSLCSPSRASILSGLYAHSHGVSNNFTEYPANMVSFPMQLKESGYETAYVGKWHMGEDNDNPRPGFDYFVTHKGQGKYFDTAFNFNGDGRRIVPGYYTSVVTTMAKDWLSQRKGQQPWMLMLGHKAPHSFYTPEEKYENTFNDVTIPYPRTAFHLDDKPAWFKKRLDTWHGIYGPLFDWRENFPDESPKGVRDFTRMVRAYMGTILSVDDSVGELYSFLETSGQLDNTLIIFTSDNGLLEGEHGMVDKRTGHEPSIRIPLVIRYPKLTPVTQPRVIEQLTATIDFAPSILDVCQAAPLDHVHGKSWRRLASGETSDWRDSFYYEYNYEHQFPYTPNVRALRSKRWKYIRYPHGDGSPDRHMAELYDVTIDPEEDKNLIHDPAFSDTVVQLRHKLDRLISEHGDGKPDRMPLDQGIQSGLPDKSIR
jgi:N-acetylglucosamine-6-sulfatase